MANPLGARKNGKFKAVSTAPSFNKTPVGNSTPPVPYPVYHDLSNSTGTASNVNFNGDPVNVLNQTTQSKCTGDNPGTAKGIKSGTVNGEIKPTSASSTVRIGKKPLVREGDKCTLNSGNCPGVYVTEPAVTPPAPPKEKPSASPDIHDVLDVLGFIPGLGAIPDLANAGIYALQGNYAMAGLSVVAAVPGYGDAVKGGAMVVKGGKKLLISAEKRAVKELAENEAKNLAKQDLKQETKQIAKETVKKKGPGDGGRVKGTPKDPCKHDKGKKLKKYVVYMAELVGQPGKYYIGRTSGSPDLSTRQILKKRKSGHHRKDIGELTKVFETDSYSAARGAEQTYKDKMTQNGTGTKQIEPISKRNKKKTDYLDCAKLKGI